MRCKLGTIWLADGTKAGGMGVVFQGGTGDEWEAEIAPVVNGVNVATFDRQNHSFACTFTVSRQHATQDAADTFILDHGASLPRFTVAGTAPAPLQFLTKTDGGSETSRFLRGAVLQSVKLIRQIGVHTEHSYSFAGREIAKQA